MPSTTDSSFSRPEPSSTVITPSLPTRSMASAMILPMDSSELAEMVPTWAMDLESAQGLARFFSSATTAAVALSIPRFRSIGFMPAATAFRPSVTMAWARTVAVVVPSPASSLAREATSLTSCAPMFSKRSFSSISLATDTPSLVISGAPKLRSISTLRPFGPRVDLTASARVLTPSSILLRAATSNRTSLAAIFTFLQMNSLRDRMGAASAFQHTVDFGFAHHQQLFTIDLDGAAAGVRAKYDLVTFLHSQGTYFTIVQQAPGTHSNHHASVRLLSCRARQNDTASAFCFFFAATNDYAIV